LGVISFIATALWYLPPYFLVSDRHNLILALNQKVSLSNRCLIALFTLVAIFLGTQRAEVPDQTLAWWN